MEQYENVHWPGWEVVRLIGNGSFGSVYEIQRALYGNVEKAALKVIHIPHNHSDIEELYNDGYDSESITARFNGYLQDIIREYSMMANMKGNKNIVYCDDVRQIQHEDGIGWDIYIKMELLTPLVKSLGKEVPEQQVVDIGLDMCSALVLCKEHNIIHRDIKPQNIFVSPDGTYKLGDFGIAKTAERTTSGTKTGTYKYMAPEVYRSQPYGAAADQYSLGMVLYWLLNERRTPFLPLPSEIKAPTVTMEDEARKRRFDGESIPRPAHGSKQLQDVVLKACAYDPKDRYSSAEEMLNALRLVKPDAEAASVSSEDTVYLSETASGTVTANAAVEDKTVGIFSSYEPNASATVTAAAMTTAQPPTTQTPPAVIPAGPAAVRPGNVPAAVRPEAKPAGVRSGNGAEPKKKLILWISIAAAAFVVAVVGAVLLLTGKSGSPTAHNSTTEIKNDAQQTDLAEETTEETLADAPAVQLDWTEWADRLPGNVTEDAYLIEERTLYSSRQLETTSSTTSSGMDGWELYDTAKGNGGYGPWSSWSQTEAIKTDTRNVETQIQYRYRDTETTTSDSDTLSGWTLYDTKVTYGAWSGWSDTEIVGSDTCQVESRQVEGGCRYQLGHWCAVYTDGTEGGMCSQWGPFSDADLAANHLGNQQFHSIGWFTSSSSTPDVGQMQGQTPCPRGYTTYSATNIETSYTTQYRYRDITTTYCFYRWKDWSGWSATPVTETDNREVETATFYRYCDRVNKTTYYFRRWTDWSDFTETPVEESETVEVETKTQYRFKSR